MIVTVNLSSDHSCLSGALAAGRRTYRCRHDRPRRPIQFRSPAPPPAKTTTPQHLDQCLRRGAAAAPARLGARMRAGIVLDAIKNVSSDFRRSVRERSGPGAIARCASLFSAGRPFSGGGVTFKRTGRAAATPTFSETFSSFSECVRSLWVRNLSIIEPRPSKLTRLSRAGSSGAALHCTVSRVRN